MSTDTPLKQILINEAEYTYAITERLFHRLNDKDLPWKPATGTHWMTVGQLLIHCASYGCGRAVEGFVKNDWGLLDLADDNSTAHLPKAEGMPAAQSVDQALRLLALDRELTIKCLHDVPEPDLLARRVKAPWGGPERSLFEQLLSMLAHLSQHKGQLFYYLKLIGQDVATADLWG